MKTEKCQEEKISRAKSGESDLLEVGAAILSKWLM